jgi:GNAT superfamily N-acetyltransferase
VDTRVQTAEGDAWQVHGRLRAGTRTLHGIRCMASGLPHAQWNNGDVTAPDADLEGARAFYSEHGVPWGVRVPAGMPWSAGRLLFRKRLMGLLAAEFEPAPEPVEIELTTDLEAVCAIDAIAFESEPARDWIGGHLGRPGVETALAWLDGTPVATAYSVFSDGLAGPALYLAGVAVLPEARGRGVGAAISSWLVRRGFERGAELAHLHPDGDGAARLYARLGFVEVAGFDVYVEL